MTPNRTLITRPDPHGRKLRDARKVVTMSTERGIPINIAAATVAEAGGWAANGKRIEEVADLARDLL